MFAGLYYYYGLGRCLDCYMSGCSGFVGACRFEVKCHYGMPIPPSDLCMLVMLGAKTLI